MEWRKAAKGIRYRFHPTRKHGKQLDKYFVIRYSANGIKKQEAFGWTLDKAQEQLSKLKSGLKTGDGPQRLADKRRIAQEQAKANERQRLEDERKGVTLSEYYKRQYEPWKSLAKPITYQKQASHWLHWLEPQLGDIPVRSIGLEQWY